jgi:MFS family permease
MGFAAPPGIVAATAALGYDWRVPLGVIATIGTIYAVLSLTVVRRYVDRAVTAPSDTSRSGETWSLRRIAGLPGRAVSALRGMLAERGILLVTVLWLVTSMAAWGIKTQTLPLLTGIYGLPEATGNILVSAMFVVGAVLMFGGGWLTDRTSPEFVLVAGYVALVVATGVLATGMLPVALVVVVTLLLASTIDYSRPARATLADRFSRSDSIGKNFGLVTIGISGGSAVAPPVLGFVSDTMGVEASFAVMAALGILSLALTAVVVQAGKARRIGSPRPGDD